MGRLIVDLPPFAPIRQLEDPAPGGVPRCPDEGRLDRRYLFAIVIRPEEGRQGHIAEAEQVASGFPHLLAVYNRYVSRLLGPDQRLGRLV
nr:hypothetical protein [Brevundimonas naejangsanensis]